MPENFSTKLRGLPLILARLSWAILVLLSVALLAIGTWDKIQAPLPTDCAINICNPIEFSGEDAAELRSLDLPAPFLTTLLLILNLLFNAGFIGVALILGWRKSDDWLALMLSATLAILGGVAFSPANDVLYRTRPALGPLVNWLQQPAYISISLLVLIFPDGRFVPRWTWILALPLSALPVYTFITSSFSIESYPLINIVFYLAFILVVVYSQVYRYRRVSTPVQRQQTKWGLLGLLGAFFIMVSWSVVAVAFPPEDPTRARAVALLVVWPVLTLVGLLMPTGFAVAVLRYRLWDIDLIIRRTLLYTALTGILALVYFGAIVVLQGLFQRLTGQAESPLATVLSTLAIAALFNPLRTRLQEFIDQRFYRRKYDAARSLDQFAQAAQDEVDVERLTGELVGIVGETMHPEHVSLWLREGPEG